MPEPFASSKLITQAVFDLSLGVFYDVHPKNIPVGGAAGINNLIWINGYVRPRPGLSSIFPVVDSNEIVHLSSFVPLIGETALLRVSKTASFTMHIHKYTVATGWVRITPLAGIANVLSPDGDPPSSVNFNGIWFIAPGDSGLYYYDGTTFDTVNSLITEPTLRPFDKPKFVTSTESRLFIANCLDSTSGGTRVPYRLAWSDKNNAFIWSTGGADDGQGSARFEDLPKASEPITAIYGGPNSTVLVFKPTYVFIGNPVGSPMFFEFLQLIKGPGCISSQTVKEWRNGKVICLGDDNVYIQTPGQIPEPIGDRIRPRLSTFSQTINLNKAVGSIDRDNDLYQLIVPEASGPYSGNNLRQLWISLRNGSWWEGVYNLGADYINCSHEYRTGTWQSIQLLGTKNGKIYSSTLNSLLDDAAQIPVSWLSGIIQFRELVGGKTDQAQVQMLRAYANAGELNFGLYSGDGFDRFSYTDFGLQTFDGIATIDTTERVTSENFQVLFYHSSASSFPITLSGIALGFILQGNTRGFR